MLEHAREAVRRGAGFAALDLLREAIAAPRPRGAHWAAIAQLCAELYDDDAALAASQRLWQETPQNVATAFILARALEATGRVSSAIALLEPVAGAGQLGVRELFHLSRMLMFAGRLEQARALTRRLLHAEPANPFFWERLAQLKHFAAGDADIDSLRAVRERLSAAAPLPRASAAWALAKAYVDLGDDERAATMLEEAAACRRRLATFVPESIETSARAALAALRPEELEPTGGRADESARVVFILGPQRSGTTLVEQILASHPQMRGGGELKFLPLMKHALGDFTRAPIQSWLERARREHPEADPWMAIRRRYLALADERFGPGARFTDKLLSNHLRLAVILRAFPAARIVRCRRDPLEVAWSCWRAHFGTESVWNSSPAWIARYIAAYEGLLDAWQQRHPDAFVEVDYAQLVRRPDEQIPRLLHACGLPDDPATRQPHEATHAVSTSSFAQVREPIHDRQIGAASRFPRATRALREALAAQGLSSGMEG